MINKSGVLKIDACAVAKHKMILSWPKNSFCRKLACSFSNLHVE